MKKKTNRKKSLFVGRKDAFITYFRGPYSALKSNFLTPNFLNLQAKEKNLH